MNTPENPFGADHGDDADFEEFQHESVPEMLNLEDKALVELISEHYKNHPGVMFANPALEQDSGVLRLAIILNEWCLDFDNDDTEAAAVYRALQFALGVAKVRTGSDSFTLDLEDYSNRIAENDSRSYRLMATYATEYYERYPSDKQIVDMFMEHLDSTGEHKADVRTIYGFVMECMNRWSFRQHLQNELHVEWPAEGEDPEMDALLQFLYQDFYSDISRVRGDLVRQNDHLIPAAMYKYWKDTGNDPDLDRDEMELSEIIQDRLNHKLANLESAPREGDTIVAYGRGTMYKVIQDKRGNTVCEPVIFDEDTEIHGTFKQVAPGRYLDESILDLPREKWGTQAMLYVRPFGVNFVLEDVVVRTGGAVMQMEWPCNLPLHHLGMDIQVIRTSDSSDFDASNHTA